ncbi:SDR family NAD(P)-dependent oxidoreductase [Verminephrobacter eiseniae]|uniref:SDR family NAD(P)-dependent oxidoreductase n=1 Tax=Verminephrobacter eiseniae TaxID=364317 RepID=UPI00223875BF|nr:SDR family oxidoreductase [Verminephrobacter eiseniae]
MQSNERSFDRSLKERVAIVGARAHGADGAPCHSAHARHRQGAIVNVASVAGLIGGHPSLLYPTSKGAVVNMTRAMAAHHGAQGIRVNCVAPGMVHTPMVHARGMSEETREVRRKRSFLQTQGSGWDVGHAIRCLASDESGGVTGAIVPVDAGATAGRHSY